MKTLPLRPLLALAFMLHPLAAFAAKSADEQRAETRKMATTCSPRSTNPTRS
jgi:hypothetical protein